jgi:hypothetical protein
VPAYFVAPPAACQSSYFAGRRKAASNLSGHGQMWRRQGDQSEIVEVHTGLSLTIPLGTQFQFRSASNELLAAVSATIPPWPGEGEAIVFTGPWQSSVPR